MIFTNMLPSDNHSEQTSNPISRINRIVCTLATVLAVYSFLRCLLSVLGALDDMEKYGGLGFSHSFWHYLCKNGFPIDIVLFVFVIIEFLLYIVQYRRIGQMSSIRGSSWYFSFMIAFHTIVWIYAYSFAQDSSLFAVWEYRFFANTTILPSYAYFLLFLLTAHKIKLNKYS